MTKAKQHEILQQFLAGVPRIVSRKEFSKQSRVPEKTLRNMLKRSGGVKPEPKNKNKMAIGSGIRRPERLVIETVNIYIIF